MINKCRGQHGGKHIVRWDITWLHMWKVFSASRYRFSLFADMASCVSECHLPLTFCNVFCSDESHLLTMHDLLLQQSL